jgi:hypothetical protein
MEGRSFVDLDAGEVIRRPAATSHAVVLSFLHDLYADPVAPDLVVALVPSGPLARALDRR